MREIKPSKHLNVIVKVPGSKSYTQRALAIASLAEGESVLRNALHSEDTDHLITALRLLGAEIDVREDDILVKGTAGRIGNPHREIFLGNNGTAIRLLSSIVCLGEGPFTLTGDDRLCKRPIRPLIDALKMLGAEIRTRGERGFPPVTVRAHGLRGGDVVLREIGSSQYISSLLISGALTEKGCNVRIQGPVPSRPYVDMTMETMMEFGVEAAAAGSDAYRVVGRQCYRGIPYDIEGDVSAASYFFLAAALSEGTVRVENIRPATMQGDIRLLAIMEKLGVRFIRGRNSVTATAGRLDDGDHEFDMGDMPDMVPTLAVLSAVRSGRTAIFNVSQLRIKESDRIAALVNELRRVGAGAEELEDGLVINGGNLHGADIETYNDHRIAMGFAVLGLSVPGIRIKNPSCVRKSFPGFWNELDRWC
jgi:3-phosphoshikimate 1-carboxyvinyltransferase